MEVFDIPTKTEPKWKFWLAYILGKTIHKESGLKFKKWLGCIWVFGTVTKEEPNHTIK